MDQCFATATLFETRCFKRRSFPTLFVFRVIMAMRATGLPRGATAAAGTA